MSSLDQLANTMSPVPSRVALRSDIRSRREEIARIEARPGSHRKTHETEGRSRHPRDSAAHGSRRLPACSRKAASGCAREGALTSTTDRAGRRPAWKTRHEERQVGVCGRRSSSPRTPPARPPPGPYWSPRTRATSSHRKSSTARRSRAGERPGSRAPVSARRQQCLNFLPLRHGRIIATGCSHCGGYLRCTEAIVALPGRPKRRALAAACIYRK